MFSFPVMMNCWPYKAKLKVPGPSTQTPVKQSLRGNDLPTSADQPGRPISGRNGKPPRPQLRSTRAAQSTGLRNNYHYLPSLHKEPLAEQGSKLESFGPLLLSLHTRGRHAGPEGRERRARLGCNYFQLHPSPEIPSCHVPCRLRMARSVVTLHASPSFVQFS